MTVAPDHNPTTPETQMTPEQHYERGLELLTQAERYTDHNLAIWYAQRATAHFAAASAGTQLRPGPQIHATPCARRRGTAPVDGCPCVNCTLARPEPPVACSELPSCRDGEHSASCEVSLAEPAREAS